MATQTANLYLNMMDWARMLDPNGGFYKLAEVLNKKNAIWQDAVWREANMKLVHLLSLRTSLPTGTLKKFYGNVMPEKAGQRQVTEHVALLKGLSEVDPDEAKMSGDINGFRDNQLRAYIEGMMQTMAQLVFYGDRTATPEGFDGLATRLATLAALPTPGKALGAGGTGSKLTSVYIASWGEDGTHLLFPTGQPHEMVQTKDLGLQMRGQSDGSVKPLLSHYCELSGGLAIADARSVMRVANIQTDIADASLVAHMQGVFRKIAMALRFIPGGAANAVIYANNDFLAMADSYMDMKTGGATSLQYKRGEVGSLQIGEMNGRPVKLCEQIISGEAAVA